MVRVGGMPWLKTGVTHHHVQLGLFDKNHEIKGLVVVGLQSMFKVTSSRGNGIDGVPENVISHIHT